MSEEFSESGAPIYRHKAREREWSLPSNCAVHLEAIESHLEKYVGKISNVYHELLSDLVHLDVLVIEPSGQHPFYTLVTSGVSDMPMSVPEGLEEFQLAELMICLPADWKLSDEDLKEEKNYWPIYWLKTLGRLPHEYKTWIGWGHSIPNGDPAEPIADTKFTGFMLVPPIWLPPEFFQLEIDSEKKIMFYNLMPLYQAEMDLKLNKGAEALEDGFERNDISQVVDVNRPNVAKRKGWFG